MRHAGRCTFLLAFSLSSFVCAQAPDSLPAYQARAKVSGTIRVWGSAQMADLMTGWQKSFARYHPEARFDNHLYGAVSAIAGLYTGVADMAVSRAIRPIETLAFEHVVRPKPAAIH